MEENERREIQECLTKKQKEAEEQFEKEKEERVKNALKYWDEAKENLFHEARTAYLEFKKIKPYGVKFGIDPQGKASLVIPIRNLEGQVRAVQFISHEGEKRIYGLKKGNFHLIGQIKDESLIFICEGYATGASIYEALR